MFGEFSLTYGLLTFGITFGILLLLANTDTCDAEKLFSRRER